ncbi:MAG TPA: hypothetical protein VH372_15590 [Actinospica sp.]|jgi:hypothetical protein|nr:hypothetical protein [Actinospica sp.]
MTHGAFEPLVGVDRYTEAGRLRTDDLAVRTYAAELLARAAQRIGEAAVDYQHTILPPSTREQPFPPAELKAPMDVARRCAQRYTALADRLRNAPFPPDPKKAWKQLRGPGAARLLELDRLLQQQAEFAASVVDGVSAPALSELPVRAAEDALGELTGTLDERLGYLSGL